MSDAELVPANGDRVAGVCLCTAAALTVFTMAHHPSHSHGGSSLGAIVHGVMIALLTLILYGFLHFSLRRGLEKPLILMGLVVYSVSAIGHVFAATINGFIAPSLSAKESVGHDILILCWESNQAFARLGVFATGTAFVLWSIDFLWSRHGLMNRAIGVVGIASGLGPAWILLDGRAMNVPTAFAIYATHAVWTVLIGVQLIRRQVIADPVAESLQERSQLNRSTEG